MTKAAAVSVQVSVHELEHHTKLALQVLGYSPKESAIIQRVLLYAQLRGNTQGVVKLVTKSLDKSPNSLAKDIAVEQDTPTTAAVNGNQHCGMLVVQRATDIAISKAKATGASVVTCRNYATSTGAIGFYAQEIARHGLIGLVFSGSPELVAPHGGTQPLFGTNPIAIGFPRANHDTPLVMDLATSAISYFAIILAKLANQTIADNVAIDTQGTPTTDPAAVHAILPFGGHKGSALALAVELFSNALAGGAIHDKDNANDWASCVIAIDPTRFHANLGDFTSRVEQILGRVKSNPPIAPGAPLWLPGERGNSIYNRHVTQGTIAMESSLWRQLQEFTAVAKTSRL
ncbi:hypothetical protein DYB37_000482 [Aphanomyces astaci]|uniref:Ureidoglycolate dehydrogenase n=1 Tax=Aphanomyces astaci TaxID=112090 RepID=A0A3R6WWV6_APHAT|nr:hypothetical protein DYB35_000365 [Aphanomyces astaci]RHZ30013.1 hypothetical protein DYB37_000482 [Aphanomyces astaci]